MWGEGHLWQVLCGGGTDTSMACTMCSCLCLCSKPPKAFSLPSKSQVAHSILVLMVEVNPVRTKDTCSFPGMH